MFVFAFTYVTIQTDKTKLKNINHLQRLFNFRFSVTSKKSSVELNTKFYL